MAEAANANPGLVVMEAFHYQYHPFAKRLVEIVRSGELGNVTNIDVSFSAPLWKKGDIRYQLPLAGGATMDMGCYPDQPPAAAGPGAARDQRRGQALVPRRRPGHGRPFLAARRRARPHRVLHVLVVGAAPPRGGHGGQREDLRLQPLQPRSTGTG